MARGGINVSLYDFFLPVKQNEDGSATPLRALAPEASH